MYAQYLAAFGNLDEAIEQFELALRDDPLHLLCRSQFSAVLYEAGRHVDAETQIDSVLEIDQGYGVANWYLAVFRALADQSAAVRALAERAYELRPWDTLSRGLLAGVIARDGGDSERVASLLADEMPGAYGAGIARAAYHLVGREVEQCAQALRHAIGEHDYRVHVLVPFVRHTPHWHALARTMNLPVS